MNDKIIIKHPHDRFFKMLMTDKRIAKDFFKAHLPKDILPLIDLDHLELCPGNFVNDFGQESIVDIIYKTKIVGYSGDLYLLVDHQSTPDKLMSFRFLKYAVNIIDRDLKDTDKKSFPMVLPIVLYNGKTPWNYSTNVNDLVDSAKEVVEKYFLKPFCLIDLNRIDDEILKQHASSGVMTLTLKHIFEKDLLPYIPDIFSAVNREKKLNGINIAEPVLLYILNRAELSDREKFNKLVKDQLSSK